MLIDTHCHLDLTEKFISLEEVFNNCKQNKVKIVIQIATDLQSSLWNKNFINNYNKLNQELRIYWTAGIHPESIKSKNQLEEMIQFIKNNLNDQNLIGIGETGLDFYQNPETKEIQIESFYEHLKLGKELNLPVIVHSRDDKQYNENKTQAIDIIHQIAKEINYEKGIMHCFTYSFKEAKKFLDLGWYISFSGIVTFKNAIIIQECAKKIPLSNILIETDSPFLAPIPYRGKTNQPGYVFYVFEFLSELLQIEKEVLLEILKKNSKTIFNLQDL